MSMVYYVRLRLLRCIHFQFAVVANLIHHCTRLLYHDEEPSKNPTAQSRMHLKNETKQTSHYNAFEG